jgi:aminoglycoside phosphotransferase (APT) family kinase protein
VLEQVAAILAGVHGLDLEGLPAWTPARDLAKLDRLLALLAAIDDGAAATLRRAATPLAERMRDARPRIVTIHRDFTRRHVLLVPGGTGAARVGILDWDSISTGPPEKDLATLVAGIGDAGPELLDRYESATRGRLDRDLVAALVGLQRLTRACRRLLAGERPPAWAAEAAAALSARSPVAT